MSNSLLSPRARFIGAAVSIAVVLSGCGGSPYDMAVVEGVVTLDGEPLPGVRVTFSPIGGPSNPKPGPRSIATTNDQGEFRLATRDGLDGAVIGGHRVRLSTRKSTADTKNPLKEVVLVPEKVPRSYRRGGALDTTVPPAGLRNLVFDLTSDR